MVSAVMLSVVASHSTFFLLLLRHGDLVGVGVVVVAVRPALFRETECHDLLEEDVCDADGQRYQ
jgi:hypothetical protein